MKTFPPKSGVWRSSTLFPLTIHNLAVFILQLVEQTEISEPIWSLMEGSPLFSTQSEDRDLLMWCRWWRRKMAKLWRISLPSVIKTTCLLCGVPCHLSFTKLLPFISFLQLQILEGCNLIGSGCLQELPCNRQMLPLHFWLAFMGQAPDILRPWP